MDVYEKYGGPVVGVRKVPLQDADRYGMLEVEPVPDGDGHVMRALSVIEKPGAEKAPSDLAQIGGFLLTPDVFDVLEHTTVGTGGEIYLADALVKLMKQRPVYTCEFTGTRYDAGSKLDYLRATVEIALADDELGPEFRTYLQGLDLGAFPGAGE